MWFPNKKESVILTGGADEPWLTREFIEIFKSWNTKDWSMFEWGTGSSTYWFSSKVKKLISMDNSPYWHQFTKEILEKAGVENTILHLESLSSDAYYNTIMNYNPFDCILVDGRNRVRCIRSALQRIKSCGVVILDNSDRAETSYHGNYKVAFELLKDAKEHYSTTNGIWKTDYWII